MVALITFKKCGLRFFCSINEVNITYKSLIFWDVGEEYLGSSQVLILELGEGSSTSFAVEKTPEIAHYGDHNGRTNSRPFISRDERQSGRPLSSTIPAAPPASFLVRAEQQVRQYGIKLLNCLRVLPRPWRVSWTAGDVPRRLRTWQ